MRDAPSAVILSRPKLGGRLPNPVVLVIGTRPEAIKLAPVAAALDRRAIPPLLLFTGQHPQLDAGDYGLDAFASMNLACVGERNPHEHVEAVTKSALPVLAAIGPALVVVQGDTSSALGAALAAQVAGIPLAHVEAGLRSHDRRRPWPEEEFRVAIDRDCDLLFAPTELSAANLRREGAGGEIHVTGNTGIDALAAFRGQRAQSRRGPRLLVTCHRRENWTDGLDGVAAAVRAIADEGIARVEVVLHPNPALAARVRDLLLGHPGVALKQPCGHSENLEAMLSADLLLSDSGGMQEEAAALGVPLLVLREKTERPEAIASGNIEMVGTSSERIVEAVRRRLSGASPIAASDVFGDGRASERIAAIIEGWLDRRGVQPVGATELSIGG